MLLIITLEIWFIKLWRQKMQSSLTEKWVEIRIFGLCCVHGKWSSAESRREVMWK